MQVNAQIIRESLSEGLDCMPLAELEARLESGDVAALEHLLGCPHCSTELYLSREMLTLTPSPEERSAVDWIESRMNAPRPPAPARRRSWLKWLRAPMTMAPAAMALAAVLIVIGIGVQRDRITPAGRGNWEGVERGQSVGTLSPKGEIAGPPEELRWLAYDSAARYRVRIVEVDHVVLWQTEVSAVSVRVPLAVQRQALPGKRLIWEVDALASDGKVIARGSQDFRRQLPGSR